MLDSVAIFGGLGYLGYNLAEYLQGKNVETVILTRDKSIWKRRFIYNKALALGLKIMAYGKLDGDIFRRLSRSLDEGTIVYSIGVNKGDKSRMMFSNTLYPNLLLRLIARYFTRAKFMYISSYNVYRYTLDRSNRYRFRSRYGESKALAEKTLIMNGMRYGIDTYIVRPGILIGRYPFHPEWHTMYWISRLGFILETGIYTSYTPCSAIGSIIEELDRYRSGEILNLTFYKGDFGLPTRYFTEFWKKEGRIFNAHIPEFLEGLLPYEGIYGFIKEFISGPEIPKPIEDTSYKVQYLLEELHKMFRSIHEIYSSKDGIYQLIMTHIS